MSEDKKDLQARREELRERFAKPVKLNDKDNELLLELVRGAEVCFANAEQLFQEATLLREHKHFCRSIFLYQIAMEECAKVDMIGAAATALTFGHPVRLGKLEKAFRDHKAKNYSNAYMSEASVAEKAARKANDKKAASAAFKDSQREIHAFLNTAKNASMYVDLKNGKFVAPTDVVDEEAASMIAALSYYFMSVTYPRLRPLRRMLDEPNLHSELMAGCGEAMLKGLTGDGSMDAMEESISNWVREMAATLASKDKRKPEPANSSTNPPGQD
jgi:AbiV family abortive infection protein